MGAFEDPTIFALANGSGSFFPPILMKRASRFLALGVLVVSAEANAAPASVEAPVEEQLPEISQGIVTSTCQWPTTLLVNGCTATLVHPRVVTTAAHCGTPSVVRFGEGSNKIVASVPIDFCVRRPEWSSNDSNGVNGWDAQVCVLDSPVTTVPIAPVAMGCEIHQIGKDSDEVYIAGFGNNSDNGGFGTKRYIDTIIRQDLFTYGDGTNAVFVGTTNKDSCSGDSGGPAYVRLEDGVFRTFGITSGGPEGCGVGGGTYVFTPFHVPWAEENTGVDFTPCTDADGTWNPGPDCGDFSMDPIATGTWQNGCDHQRSGLLDSCGPAYGEAHPLPVVNITSPLDQQVFDVDGGAAAIDIASTVDHPWPIREVRFVINEGVAGYDPNQGVDFYQWPPPPTFEGLSGNFPEGTYDIRIEAEDWGGKVGYAQVNVAVGNESPNPPPPPPPTDEGGAEGDDGGAGDDAGDDGGTGGVGTDSGTGGADGSEDGCACDSGGSRSPLGALALLIPMGFIGRRRRAR